MDDIQKQKPLIVVIDDEKTNLRVMEMTLEDEYDVITAKDGKEGIEKSKKMLPDLILLDVMMPELSGFDVCKKLKDDPLTKDIPVIFVTALENIEDETTGLEAGGVDYITKPINPDITRLRVRAQITLQLQKKELEKKNLELEETISRIKLLEGIITICMYCKNVKLADKSWQRIEEYVSDHSDAMFSHGICPDCFNTKMLPEIEALKNITAKKI